MAKLDYEPHPTPEPPTTRELVLRTLAGLSLVPVGYVSALVGAWGYLYLDAAIYVGSTRNKTLHLLAGLFFLSVLALLLCSLWRLLGYCVDGSQRRR